MDSSQLAISAVVAKQKSWRIYPAYSRDYCEYGYFDRPPSEILPNPTVVLRRLNTNYVVPLLCDFCGKRKPIYQATARLWCGECPAADHFKFWFN